eukprot:TRINITY_DN61951_c0_g1_i1.p1 TRINITY_DN61951_c0_g1~~TRINITY_DN61951_c0_g1_i1.p1  ORF type:complete len:1525 (-),score=322.06 TRINITY_DN61951_c0_g1_i1:23-4537(-)
MPQLLRAATMPVKSAAQQTRPGQRRLERRRGSDSNLECPQSGRTSPGQGSPQSRSPAAASSSASVVVVARVRPRLAKEMSEPEGVEVQPDGQTLVLANGRERKQFTFDHVFDTRPKDETQPRGSPKSLAALRQAEASDQQASFFASFGRSLVTHSLKGYNVCVFAYGHTGSGKTYTMLGDAGVHGSANGLLPRFLHELFAEQAKTPRANSWRCSCEFFEVYNEQIRDLLQPAQAQRARKVHCHPKHGARIEGLTMSVVSSADEVLDLVHFGNQMRTVAATTMNLRSSRSHAFFNFKYEQLPAEGSSRRSAEIQPCQSAVTFVDLAGREDRERLANQPGAVQYREMCFINTSLFHLAHLITKLSSGQIERGSLSDFRNSKVTMLLSQALSGNSRTAVVATLSPLQSAFEDSLSTLNFAASAKKIQTKPVVNSRTSTAAVTELEAEVRQLQRELAESKTSNVEKEAELTSAQSWISYYKRSWEEAVARSEQQKLARTRSAKRLGLTQSGQSASLASLSGVLNQEADVVEEVPSLPFLTKLCDDPALQGCCNFSLDRPLLHIGSEEGTCDIVLKGLGITRQMCSVHYSKGGDVMVEALPCATDEGPVRALLNGQAMKPEGGSRVMQHGDCLILGYAHAFRLVDPTPDRVCQAGSPDALQVARSTVTKLDVSSALEEALEAGKHLEDSEDLVCIFPFISQLSSRTSDDAVQAFLGAVRHINPLVEEANLITKELLGNNDLRLEMQALTNVSDYANDLPEIVVCVLENPGPTRRFQQTVKTVQRCLLQQPAARGSEHDTSQRLGAAKHPLAHALGLGEHMSIAGHGQLLCVWSLEEFLRRLSEIRDMYQDASESGGGFEASRLKLAANPFQNPWHQATFADVKVLADAASSIRNNPILRWLLRCPNLPREQVSPKNMVAAMPSPLRAGQAAKTSAPQRTPNSSANAASLRKRPEPLESGELFVASPERGACSPGDSQSPSSMAVASPHEVEGAACPSLATYWRGLLADEVSTDVRLCIAEPGGGRSLELSAHTLVLSRIPFFRRLLTERSGMSAPLLVPHMPSLGVLRQILLYVYTDSAREATAGLSPNMLRDLQKAASTCGLSELCQACCQKIAGNGKAVPSLKGRLPPAANARIPRTLEKNDGPQPEVIYDPASSESSGRSQPLALQSGSSMGSSTVVLEQEGESSKKQKPSPTPRLSSGSLEAFTEEMARLREAMAAQQGNGAGRAVELLEDLQSHVTDAIKQELRDLLKEAQEENAHYNRNSETAAKLETATFSSIASGVAEQLSTLRDDLMTLLRTSQTSSSALAHDDRMHRCASRSPERATSTEPTAVRSGASCTCPARQSPPMAHRAVVPTMQPSASVRRLVIRAPATQTSTAARSPSPQSPVRRRCNMSCASQNQRNLSASPLPRSQSPLPRPYLNRLATGWSASGARTPQAGWCTLSQTTIRPSPGPRTLTSSASTGSLLPLSGSWRHSMPPGEPVASEILKVTPHASKVECVSDPVDSA